MLAGRYVAFETNCCYLTASIRSAEYILGCELDGTLFAVDAESGDVRWRLENPTKTFFRSSASVADLTEALRKNDSLKAPLFVPSLDGGLFFFTETGSFQVRSEGYA